MTRTLVLVLFGVSGASGLVYEVLWLRYFAVAFGVTAYATSVVLAAFMGGLALGSWLLARLGDRVASPLRAYGLLEIGIGLYALGIPAFLGALPALYRVVHRAWADEPAALLLVRLAASAAILLVPTTMMGATLPILARFFALERHRVGRESGRLYAVNTFGAVAGTLAAGFVLVPSLGVRTMNTLAAALSVLVGLAALAIARRATGAGRPAATAREPRGGPARHERRARRLEAAAAVTVRGAWVLPLIALSGFAALAYEVLWTRVLTLITFNTVFAFTGMLAAFLTGIAGGGALYVCLLDGRRNLWAWFAALQAGIGAYALLSPYLFGDLAAWFYRYQTEAARAGTSWEAFTATQFLLAVAVMLLPTLLMGAAVPLACRIYAARPGGTAARVGEVFASNTLGAILGAALPGVILVPALGLKAALAIAATANLLAAAAALVLADLESGRRPLRAAAVAPVAAALYLLGLNVDVAFTAVAREGREIVYQEEDATGVVEVFQQGEARWLVTNRLHSEGSNLPEAVYLQRKQGYLPLLLHPRPASVVEIGLGTGIGFAPVVLDDRVERAEMVEISAGVAGAARFFARESLDVLSHPKLRLRIDDGRNHLLVTPQRYDVIVLGLFTAYQAGVGSLYTREFYRLCRERLAPGGLVVQWLALSELSPANLRIVVATFRSVFPHVSLWDKGHYLALVGTGEPLAVDFERFQAALGAPSIRDDLERSGLADPYNFLASFLMGPEGATALAAGASINTEDRPRIEFSRVKAFEAAYSLRYAAENLAALLARRELPLGRVTNLGEADRRTLERYAVARGFALVGLGYEARGMPEEAARAFRRAARLNPRDDIARFAIPRYGLRVP